MKIDIVITTFNRKKLVASAVQSALKAGVDQVIVVDDASTDGTFSQLNEYYEAHPSVQLIQNVENLGVTGAKNSGFVASNADWVIFLDSDDALLPDQFEAARDVLSKHKDCPIVFFRCVDQDGQFVGTKFDDERKLDLGEYIAHTSYGEALTAMNKSLFSGLPYDQDLRGYEGIGCMRLIKKFGPALLSNIILRRYDQERDSRLSSRKNMVWRSSLLAKGHLRFYMEFRCDMSLIQRFKMLLKIAVYYSVSFLTKSFGPCRTP